MISVEHMDELIKRFKSGELDIRDIIEQSYFGGRADAIDKIQELKEYAFDLMCGIDNEGFHGKYCMNKGRCTETNCDYKYIESKANDLIKQMQKNSTSDLGYNPYQE